MNTINIGSELQEYKLAEGCIVHFNPTDTLFLQKIYQVFRDSEKAQESYQADLAKIPEDDVDALFAYMDERDKKMRETLDGIFDVPVCAAVFGEVSVFARNTSGLPLWSALLLAIIDQCETDAGELTAKEKQAIKKYTAKYQKKRK